MRPSSGILAITLLLGLLTAPACKPSDPQLKILEERARWEVRILSWAQGPDGAINVSTQVSGPPNSGLAQLTVRFDLIGEGEKKIRSHWHTYDLAQVPRGGPSDMLVGIAAPDAAVEGLAVSLVLRPTPEEEQRIPELRP